MPVIEDKVVATGHVTTVHLAEARRIKAHRDDKASGSKQSDALRLVHFDWRPFAAIPGSGTL